MGSIFDLLSSQLGGDAIGQISRQIEADEESTARAVGGALPMMMAALSRNAQSQDGATSLFNALEQRPRRQPAGRTWVAFSGTPTAGPAKKFWDMYSVTGALRSSPV